MDTSSDSSIYDELMNDESNTEPSLIDEESVIYTSNVLINDFSLCEDINKIAHRPTLEPILASTVITTIVPFTLNHRLTPPPDLNLRSDHICCLPHEKYVFARRALETIDGLPFRPYTLVSRHRSFNIHPDGKLIISRLSLDGKSVIHLTFPFGTFRLITLTYAYILNILPKSPRLRPRDLNDFAKAISDFEDIFDAHTGFDTRYTVPRYRIYDELMTFANTDFDMHVFNCIKVHQIAYLTYLYDTVMKICYCSFPQWIRPFLALNQQQADPIKTLDQFIYHTKRPTNRFSIVTYEATFTFRLTRSRWLRMLCDPITNAEDPLDCPAALNASTHDPSCLQCLKHHARKLPLELFERILAEYALLTLNDGLEPAGTHLHPQNERPIYGVPLMHTWFPYDNITLWTNRPGIFKFLGIATWMLPDTHHEPYEWTQHLYDCPIIRSECYKASKSDDEFMQCFTEYMERHYKCPPPKVPSLLDTDATLKTHTEK
jgi:hypothetical protein